MANYNRFSVQILGTVDATSSEDLLKAINLALSSIEKFNVKAVSHDKWADGFTGKDRVFDEEGNEIVEASKEVIAQPEDNVEEVLIEEVVQEEQGVIR